MSATGAVGTESDDVACPGAAADDVSTPMTLGRRTLIAGAAGAALGTAATSLLGGSTAAAATPLSVFEPVVPSVRLAETRPQFGAGGFVRVDASTIRVDVAGRTVDGVTIPSDAVAAVLSVVGINLDGGGNFLTTYPSGTTLPTTSSLNIAGFGDVANNLVTVKLGADGAAQLYTLKPADIVVDLVGVYRPAGGRTRRGRFEPLGGLSGTGPAAKRIFSPETGGVPGDGQVVKIDVTGLIEQGLVEADAEAIVANLTVARPVGRGFLSAYPYGEPQPATSSLNYVAGSIRAANTFVRIGTDPATGRRGFNIFVLRGARLYVDVTGYITGSNARFNTTSGQFVAVTPRRILDTRSGTESMRGLGGGKRLWPGWTRHFTIPSDVRATAGAAAVNLTLVGAMAPGYLTLLPARTARQEVSSVNAYFPGQVAANHQVIPVSTDGLQVFASHGSDVVCDLVGYYQGTAVTPNVPLLPDPPPPVAAPPYTLSVPRIGRAMSVVQGASAIRTVDTGFIWHWSGTGMVAQGVPIGAFGHRTDAGGPFRNIHWLGDGDVVTLDTVDSRRYYYQYLGRELTNSDDERILAAAYRQSGEVLSLIACTVGFDSTKSAYPDAWAPTSLKYRIVVRLGLIGWEDTVPTPF